MSPGHAQPCAASAPSDARATRAAPPYVSVVRRLRARAGTARRGCASACASIDLAERLRAHGASAFSAELAPICAEDLVVGRLGTRSAGQRTHDARDVEEVPVVQIVREAVATPGAAAHRQRERQRVVEAAAGGEAVRLVDDDAAHRQREPELAARGRRRACAGRPSGRRPDRQQPRARAPPPRRNRATRYSASTGESFSPENGCSGPTPVSSTIRKRASLERGPREPGERRDRRRPTAR